MNRTTNPIAEPTTTGTAKTRTGQILTALGWVFAVALLGFSGYELSQGVSDYMEPGYGVAPIAAIKIRVEGNHQYLWAKGPLHSPNVEADWFDLTGSPLPLDRFQFGIGRDSIASIDNPVFVHPDDPRLRRRWRVRDRAGIDRLAVIGFEHAGVARAYPLELLDRHELVNDTVGGKPVTIGW